ncbi:hypothetical protein BDR06DRAFT_738545 [Suillus hirtellus]|nr:hypothetical protein BDR06DRAFT_738545 [Suillus hirtellus]
MYDKTCQFRTDTKRHPLPCGCYTILLVLKKTRMRGRKLSDGRIIVSSVFDRTKSELPHGASYLRDVNLTRLPLARQDSSQPDALLSRWHLNCLHISRKLQPQCMPQDRLRSTKLRVTRRLFRVLSTCTTMSISFRVGNHGGRKHTCVNIVAGWEGISVESWVTM